MVYEDGCSLFFWLSLGHMDKGCWAVFIIWRWGSFHMEWNQCLPGRLYLVTMLWFKNMEIQVYVCYCFPISASIIFRKKKYYSRKGTFPEGNGDFFTLGAALLRWTVRQTLLYSVMLRTTFFSSLHVSYTIKAYPRWRCFLPRNDGYYAEHMYILNPLTSRRSL